MATQVQDHIHLDVAIGTAPENAPTLTWRARRELQPEILISLTRALNGKLQAQILADSSGNPVQFENFDYEILITGGEAQRMTLQALFGRTVYLVDHYHVDDGEDHTANIRTMRMVSFKVDQLDPVLGHQIIKISLVDEETTA